ncbi:TPA: hypothetical protein ACJIWT_001544 [Enterobacter bugandensis]
MDKFDKMVLIPKLIAIVVMIATLFTGSQMVIFKQKIDRAFSIDLNIENPKKEELEEQYKKQIEQISNYRDETFRLTSMIEGLKNSSSLSSENIRIETLESQFKVLQKKIDGLESILNSSSEKAMALPLMRKDIDSLEKSIKASNDYSDKQLERFINLFYWICGTLALGIVGLCVGLFMNTKKVN